MSQSISQNQTSANTFFSTTTACARKPITISESDTLKSSTISLNKTAKPLFMIMGKLLEVNGWCRASRHELAYMLSEKIGKTLCPKQISRLTGAFAALGIITKSQSMRAGKHSYNEYELTNVGWALFYLYNFRIPKIPKCPTEEPKNVPPLITKSINEDILIPTSVVDSEIYRVNQPANKEVGLNLDLVLEEKLRDIHQDIRETVRAQAKKYMSNNKIHNPNAFFAHVINRETIKFRDKFAEHEEQQRFFRARAQEDIARTMGWLARPKETEEKKRLSEIYAECRRRAKN